MHRWQSVLTTGIIVAVLTISLTSYVRARPQLFLPPLTPDTPANHSREIACSHLLTTYAHLQNPTARERFFKQLNRHFPDCLPLAKLLTSPSTIPTIQTDLMSHLLEQNLISAEILANFPPDELKRAAKQGLLDAGDVQAITLDREPIVTGDWMEVYLTVTTEKSQQHYLVVFHLEGNGWRIFGTDLLRPDISQMGE